MYLGIMGTPLALIYLSPSFTAFVSIDGSTYALSEYGTRMAILKANNLVSFSPIANVKMVKTALQN